MPSTQQLKHDRTRVNRLLKQFDQTDDLRAKTRIMDETLATIESHRGDAEAAAYLLHGTGSKPWWNLTK